MDKINKFLLKLNKKEKNNLLTVLKKILALKADQLDIKKLKNLSNHFRVKAGKIRIIFEKRENKIILKKINFRGNIYK